MPTITEQRLSLLIAQAEEEGLPDMVRRLSDVRARWGTNPRPLTREQRLSDLTCELNAWYAHPEQSNIPERERGCAYELLMVADALGLTEAQRTWLSQYGHRWDAAARAITPHLYEPPDSSGGPCLECELPKDDPLHPRRTPDETAHYRAG